MKEMPKEIWLHNVTNPSIIGATWLERKVWDNDVEYVHKDAFIEKACEYLEPILTEYAGFYVGGDILQDFKNHMKGE